MPVTLPRKWLQAKHLPGDFSLPSRCATALRPLEGRKRNGHQTVSALFPVCRLDLKRPSAAGALQCSTAGH